MLAVWIVAATVFQVRDRMRSGFAPPSFWGMHLAHVGLAVVVVGIVMVRNHEVEKDVRMAVGDTVRLGGYEVRMLGLKEVAGPNYVAQRGDFELSKDGQALRLLHPEKRTYFSSPNPMTEAAIDTGLLRDIYVSLGEPLAESAGSAWSVRVYYKPFVMWIWGGALLMALGGALAAADRRYRLKQRKAVAAGIATARGAAA
jgi:cytochrome c-type biogenesis protein CcmF